jgi:4Fe-4S ferredoxin
VAPRVDPNRCEAKGDCVRVCPFDVFEVRTLSAEERSRLGLFARVRTMLHGNQQAFTPRLDQCHACGLCVAACPERAIRLVPRETLAR